MYFLNGDKTQNHLGLNCDKSQLFGFTIIELLVVIVVIGILAAITMVSYTGITTKANTAALMSDLSNNTTQLKIYQATNGSFPTALDTNNCPSAPVADTTHCLKLSYNDKLSYTPSNTTNPQDFRLTVSNSNSTSNYSANANGLSCPLNFIIVPGSSTYGTSDFCVMKYEARQVGASTTPISQAAGLPWVNISQNTAIANSSNVAGCTGCHLITEAEWMTIAQNVLSVPSNWSTGTVGSGYIYQGHSDNAPANALDASINDSDGYYGTGNATGNQRRTLTLTNGEVIWDLAGNVWEWTTGTSTSGQPGIAGEAAYAWKDYTAVTAVGTIAPDVMPAGTGLAGASTWTLANGIGRLYSYVGETVLRGFIRGGIWSDGNSVGVLDLYLNYSPGVANTRIGLRVTR